MDNGTDLNAISSRYGTTLCTASFKGFLGIFDLLLQKGAKANMHGGDYETPLIAAIIGMSRSLSIGTG